MTQTITAQKADPDPTDNHTTPANADHLDSVTFPLTTTADNRPYSLPDLKREILESEVEVRVSDPRRSLTNVQRSELLHIERSLINGDLNPIADLVISSFSSDRLVRTESEALLDFLETDLQRLGLSVDSEKSSSTRLNNPERVDNRSIRLRDPDHGATMVLISAKEVTGAENDRNPEETLRIKLCGNDAIELINKTMFDSLTDRRAIIQGLENDPLYTAWVSRHIAGYDRTNTSGPSSPQRTGAPYAIYGPISRDQVSDSPSQTSNYNLVIPRTTLHDFGSSRPIPGSATESADGSIHYSFSDGEYEFDSNHNGFTRLTRRLFSTTYYITEWAPDGSAIHIEGYQDSPILIRDRLTTGQSFSPKEGVSLNINKDGTIEIKTGEKKWSLSKEGRSSGIEGPDFDSFHNAISGEIDTSVWLSVPNSDGTREQFGIHCDPEDNTVIYYTNSPEPFTPNDSPEKRFLIY